jgi:hypothetical protein
VWQAAFGDYALEDESMAAWYDSEVKPALTALPHSSSTPGGNGSP